MEIRISIQTTEPLTGTATTGGKAPVSFEGWLEMLRVLSTLIGARGYPAGSPQGLPARGRESDGRADEDDVDNEPIQE